MKFILLISAGTMEHLSPHIDEPPLSVRKFDTHVFNADLSVQDDFPRQEAAMIVQEMKGVIFHKVVPKVVTVNV